MTEPVLMSLRELERIKLEAALEALSNLYGGSTYKDVVRLRFEIQAQLNELEKQ